jgi:hypothetical protein
MWCGGEPIGHFLLVSLHRGDRIAPSGRQHTSRSDRALAPRPLQGGGAAVPHGVKLISRSVIARCRGNAKAS